MLPTRFRAQVLKMAHDGTGHLGHRKVLQMIKRRFVWPLLAKDVLEYCQSCVSCQKCSKASVRKAPMMERPILMEPFEQVAVDIVGPISKAKGGFTHILTAVCMASRWPEAVPQKSTSAVAVAEVLVSIFGRTSIPLEILSDRGAQFTGNLLKELCKLLGIKQLCTTAYHPQTNGTLERLHGTLGSMLTKGSNKGQDWAKQITYALFYLRQMPHRDTGLSPFEMVFGHNIRTPLELLYGEWARESRSKLDISTWVGKVQERLELTREVAQQRSEVAVHDRKKRYDKGLCVREFQVGNLVWGRVPGMNAKLSEAWAGPFEVVARLNAVNYKVNSLSGKSKPRVVHINTLKVCVDREKKVLRLSVVAQEDEELAGCLSLRSECESYSQDDINQLLGEYPDVLKVEPWNTESAEMCIELVDEVLAPYRVPDRLKPGVKAELEGLPESEIITPSNSPYAFPIVPVTKKDGSVRVCVDYRRLNSVTKADPYYMPTLDEILKRVGQSKVLSKIDLAKGYYQVRVAVGSQEKTAFISPYGKYQFARMLFGLRNAPWCSSA